MLGFSALAAGSLGLKALRIRIGIDTRGARDFLDSLVALGLLARDNGGRYGRGPQSTRIASPFSAEQLGRFRSLNSALRAQPFAASAILCYRDFYWRRAHGWRDLPADHPSAPQADRAAHLKHHFVPQFAQRYWADKSDGKVPYFVRRNGRVVQDQLTRKYTAFEPDLYAFTDVPAKDRHVLEREFFASLDSDAAPIYEKIERRDKDLSHRERRAWARFLMAANSRVPKKVAFVKLITDKHVRRALAENPEEYLAVKGHAVEATLQEWVENNMSGIENVGLIQLAKFVVNPDRIREFLELEWVVHGL
jgi:hypothetical protein